MKADPPVKAGCAVCGKPRRPERSRRYAKNAAELDSFCSRACCEEWHGTAVEREPMSRNYGCVECGGPLSETSPGCRTCERRVAKKQARAQEQAA